MIDDELDQLEAELKRLRPAAPSAAMRARLAVELTPRRPRATVVRLAWVALPIAAGLAVAVTWTARPTAGAGAVGKPAQIAARPFKPVAAQNLLLDTRDEGTATLADGTVVRRTRESYLDTITWKNPKTNASLTWSVPREEVRVETVSYE